MIRKLGLLAVALMLSALFAVGCGDDDKSDSGGGGTATEQTDTSGGGTATESTDTESSDDSGGGSTDPNVQSAIDQCKQAVDSNPAVTDDLKDDIKSICDGIKNPEDSKKLAKEVCLKIVEKTVPSGSAQDTAKQACENAGA